jgi:hypothetical protein
MGLELLSKVRIMRDDPTVIELELAVSRGPCDAIVRSLILGIGRLVNDGALAEGLRVPFRAFAFFIHTGGAKALSTGSMCEYLLEYPCECMIIPRDLRTDYLINSFRRLREVARVKEE